LATYGAIVSVDQIDIMRRAKTLVIALDNDEPGKKASKQLLSSFRKGGLECWFFNYGDFQVKDIGDMTQDQIHWGIDNARHCVLGEAAI
jgi:DNA primase